METIEKQKWPIEQAISVAVELKNELTPFCNRIEIAGSIRRGKRVVGDIELLFVPKIDTRQQGLFRDDSTVDAAQEQIDRLLKRGTIEKRPNKNGQTSWGPSNKLAVHAASGIPVDLFSTSEVNWFVALVIRTGSKETNLRLTTGANKQGATLNAYGEGVTWSDGTITRATSERHVFEMCGVPYLEPTER